MKTWHRSWNIFIPTLKSLNINKNIFPHNIHQFTSKKKYSLDEKKPSIWIFIAFEYFLFLLRNLWNENKFLLYGKKTWGESYLCEKMLLLLFFDMRNKMRNIIFSPHTSFSRLKYVKNVWFSSFHESVLCKHTNNNLFILKEENTILTIKNDVTVFRI